MVLEGDVGFWDIRFFGHLEHPVLNIEGNFLIIEPHVRCRVRLTVRSLAKQSLSLLLQTSNLF